MNAADIFTSTIFALVSVLSLNKLIRRGAARHQGNARMLKNVEYSLWFLASISMQAIIFSNLFVDMEVWVHFLPRLMVVASIFGGALVFFCRVRARAINCDSASLRVYFRTDFDSVSASFRRVFSLLKLRLVGEKGLWRDLGFRGTSRIVVIIRVVILVVAFNFIIGVFQAVAALYLAGGYVSDGDDGQSEITRRIIGAVFTYNLLFVMGILTVAVCVVLLVLTLMQVLGLLRFRVNPLRALKSLANCVGIGASLGIGLAVLIPVFGSTAGSQSVYNRPAMMVELPAWGAAIFFIFGLAAFLFELFIESRNLIYRYFFAPLLFVIALAVMIFGYRITPASLLKNAQNSLSPEALKSPLQCDADNSALLNNPLLNDPLWILFPQGKCATGWILSGEGLFWCSVVAVLALAFIKLVGALYEEFKSQRAISTGTGEAAMVQVGNGKATEGGMQGYLSAQQKPPPGYIPDPSV